MAGKATPASQYSEVGKFTIVQLRPSFEIKILLAAPVGSAMGMAKK
jgi:hypothetical protein